MKSTTAGATIATLKNLMARYGLPDRIVTDNGPQYISEEFKSFLQQNGIRHTLSPPYHPFTNGQAEAYVKTFKRMFKKCTLPNHQKVDPVFMIYRNTPHTTTGKTPAEVFLKRSPKVKQSLVKPTLTANIEQKQMKSKIHTDGNSPTERTYDLFLESTSKTYMHTQTRRFGFRGL